MGRLLVLNHPKIPATVKEVYGNNSELVVDINGKLHVMKYADHISNVYIGMKGYIQYTRGAWGAYNVFHPND